MKKISYYIGLALSVVLASCSADDDEVFAPSVTPQEGEPIEITVSMPSNENSRVLFDDANGHLNWQEGDQLALVGYNGRGEFEGVSYLNLKSGKATQIAIFTGLTVADAASYDVYYTYGNTEGATEKHKLTIDPSTGKATINYSGQTQSEPNKTDHLRGYLLLKNAPTDGGEPQKLTTTQLAAPSGFKMSLQNSIMKFNIQAMSDKIGNLESIKWNNTNTSSSESVSLDISGTWENSTPGNVYVCFDPTAMDLTKGGSLNVTLQGSSGAQNSSVTVSGGKDYEPAKRYTIQVKATGDSNGNGVLSKWTAVTQAKLVKGSEFKVQIDGNATKLTFRSKYTGNTTNGKLVSLDGSSAAYIIPDGANTNEYLVVTEADEFLFNADCSNMFYYKYNLETIGFNGCCNTSLVTNMSQMFYYCRSLQSLTFGGKFDTSSVANMSEMFSSCLKLEVLDLSTFNTQSVANMYRMFYNCNNLTTLDLSTFNTQSVTTMSNMFKDCTNLKSLILGKTFNTQSVANMSKMFYGCTGLTTLNLSTFNTQSVTNMSGMFFGCKGLTTLDLSTFNTQSVTNMSFMFYGCTGLTTLDLSTFNTQSVTDMSSMFLGCKVLTTINLSSFNTQSVADMSSMFLGCKVLTTINLSSFNTQSVTNMSSMFDDCNALTTLDLSKINTEKVETMSRMFSGCSTLEVLDLSKINTEKVETMSRMFSGCSTLEVLDLSTFKTEKVESMNDMFSGCSNLSTLILGKFDISNVESMSSMFKDCKRLKKIDLSGFQNPPTKGPEFYNLFENLGSELDGTDGTELILYKDMEKGDHATNSMFSGAKLKSVKCTLATKTWIQTESFNGWNDRYGYGASAGDGKPKVTTDWINIEDNKPLP